ncbi:MAG: hypothetical protein R3326_09765, partial [Gemmatimonadota bacterium]|nr:hypothetical protein [Gemmatimonadota bacterium]
MTRASTGAGAIAGLVLVTALACGGEERSVAGRWMGEDPDGNRMTFHFDEGGEARWIVRSRSAARAGTIAMRYEVDTT